MFRKTRPSSQSYQVAAEWGVPRGLTVATTAGFGRARNASTSGGTGTRGTSSTLLSRNELRVGPLVESNLSKHPQTDDEQGAHDYPAGGDVQVGLEADRHRDRAGKRVARRQEDHCAHPAIGGYAG